MRAFGEGIMVVFVLSVLVIWFGTWLANRDRFPWPDAETLAAGDEDLEVEPFPAEAFWSRLYDGSPRIAETGDEGVNFDALAALPKIRFLDRRATDNSDGHLEDDDHWRRHPDGS